MFRSYQTETNATAASISKPIYDVKEAGNSRHLPPKRISCLQIWSIMTGGAYRDRTDDPLLAKQVLSQLS